MAEGPFEEDGDSGDVMELLQERAKGRTNFSLRCTKDRRVTIAVTVLAVMLLLTVAIIVLAAKKQPPCTAPTLPAPSCLRSGNNHTGGDCLKSGNSHTGGDCLESGIGFGNKCFYFLDEEVDWEGSQHSCLSRQAQLATIDTKEELHLLLRYGNFMEYWIGLWREGSGPWKWLNGSLFNALFDIQGNGHCAYTNSHRISSGRCSEMKFSICSHLQRHPSEVQKDPEILNFT